MRLVAVDTSTASGSIALVAGHQVVAEWSLLSARTHNRRLLKTLDRLLDEADWGMASVDGFAVTAGPGSFTGIRIGLSTVKTLAWATRKPLVTVATLDVLAAPFGYAATPICAMIDAKKKEVYGAFYSPDGEGRCRLVGDYTVAAPEDLVAGVREKTIFCGDGWLLYRKRLQDRLGTRAVEPPAPYHGVRASQLAVLAQERFQAGQTIDPVEAVPIYVRPSEAELSYPHLTAFART